jgi:Ras homolog gene family, member U
VNIDDIPCWLTICDTAGQDALDPLRQLCYPGSHVYLLCFSVIKPESFRSIEEKWIPEVSKLGGTLLLVGTQADLRTDAVTMARLQVSN